MITDLRHIGYICRHCHITHHLIHENIRGSRWINECYAGCTRPTLTIDNSGIRREHKRACTTIKLTLTDRKLFEESVWDQREKKNDLIIPSNRMAATISVQWIKLVLRMCTKKCAPYIIEWTHIFSRRNFHDKNYADFRMMIHHWNKSIVSSNDNFMSKKLQLELIDKKRTSSALQCTRKCHLYMFVFSRHRILEKRTLSIRHYYLIFFSTGMNIEQKKC